MKNKAKEPVRVRAKKLKNGNQSLYLDIYLNGVRKYVFLKIYLIPERNRQDRELNQKSLNLANAIKAEKILDIQYGRFGFDNSDKKAVYFFDYYKKVWKERGNTKGSYGNWQSCYAHLSAYEHDKKITLDEISPQWIQGFKDYLNTKATTYAKRKSVTSKTLKHNSKAIYFTKLKACLKQAEREGLIKSSVIKAVDGYSLQESNRMYLTVNEIHKLAVTPCPNEDVKRAFLFSCLTGIRYCDICKLRWADVFNHDQYTRIIFRQQKTGGQEYLDINKQAADLLGKQPTNNNCPVFENLKYPSLINKTIRFWAKQAGIKKYISFHSARHSFAVMMLDLGTDIYTTGKLLGHKNISTTQIYAKVLDKNKQKAISKIPNIL